MTPTSDERREIAARLRALADGKFPMDECSVDDLYTALGMPFPRAGIEYAIIGYLADLIDPTCVPEAHNYGSIVGNACPRCGWSVAGYMRYCPGCGARVVSYNGN